MRWSGPLGTFGAPPDAVAAAALALAALAALVAFAPPRFATRALAAPARPTVTLLALAASALSALWIACYLRGGPRIVDATSYLLQARALAEGRVTWPIMEPSASFRGRFSLASPDGAALGGIFPPGWPALLALGVRAGAPLAVGPLLAAALVAATFWLARLATGRTDVAKLAAALSVACAALRYHTADTMSHGLAALLFTAALGLALAAERDGDLRRAPLLGLAAGALFATRPTSALALALATVPTALALARTRGPRHLAGALALAATGAAIPVALFAWEQRAVSGGASTQLAYYAVSDGPPGCFRWGFGAGIGCLHEHAELVARRLGGGGYGLLPALATTASRLLLHLRDVANAEPLALLVPVAAWLAPRGSALRRLGLAVVAQIAAYAPFYFDGSYPGGGARLFADVLPLEHALLAWGAIALAERRGLAPARAAAALVAASLAGFALHASHDHVALRDRDGGRPMFLPSDLARAGIDRGLLLVDTDHAFALAHDPAARDAARGLVVARLRSDDRDRLLWERLGRPPVWTHRFPFWEAHEPTVRRWDPGPEPAVWRFEAEAEWPPLAQAHGWVAPAPAASAGPCASNGWVLEARAMPGETLVARLALPLPPGGAGAAAWDLTVALETRGPSTTTLRAVAPGRAVADVEATLATTDRAPACHAVELRGVPAGAPPGWLDVATRGATLALDVVRVRAAAAESVPAGSPGKR